MTHEQDTEIRTRDDELMVAEKMPEENSIPATSHENFEIESEVADANGEILSRRTGNRKVFKTEQG